jgi:hypothetical protein
MRIPVLYMHVVIIIVKSYSHAPLVENSNKLEQRGEKEEADAEADGGRFCVRT